MGLRVSYTKVYFFYNLKVPEEKSRIEITDPLRIRGSGSALKCPDHQHWFHVVGNLDKLDFEK
jgi:hypothetical protein